MTVTDTELIEQYLRGNFSAFEQLIFRYDKQVLSIASRYTQSSDDAKDIYQEVFLRVFKHLSKFEKRSEFSTWLYRITTNVCLSYRAKRKIEYLPLTVGEDGEHESLTGSEHADTELHTNEFEQQIQQALTTLSPKQRMVFTLKHFEEYKLKEIAVMMNCAEGTVKKYLFEATQKLRTHLHDLYE